MIDRRTKNADIFCDTKQRYTTNPVLMQSIKESTDKQMFVPESNSVTLPSPNKAEKAQVVVSGKRSLEAAESYAKKRQEGMCSELRFRYEPRRWRCKWLFGTRGMHLPMHNALSLLK